MLLPRFLRCLALLSGVVFLVHPPLQAQMARDELPGASAKLLEDVDRKIARGRAQSESNQAASVDTLREAAEQSLAALVSYVGPGVLTAAPEAVPLTGFQAAAARQTAEAHFWWGRAADQFGRRDEAIMALARASRFAGRLRPQARDILARDSLLLFNNALRDGLPLLAADDTLDTIAEIAHGKLWTPRRFAITLSPANFSLRADREKMEFVTQEFLITSGRVYPPVPSSANNVSDSLSRVPPIYRDVPADALPGVLRLDRMVVGYARRNSGPEKGLWRQVARVFYPSAYLTRGQRDDRRRAEALCAQFLKVHALFENALGLENPYARHGVTTLWLAEVSALWPRDDNDPRVRETIGIVMPRVNTPSRARAPVENLEIDVQSNSFPWRGIGQDGASPGEILLFNLPQERAEGEWLRELMHEYGHVALPPLDGFLPPHEPFANGLLGETLGAIWAARAPASWKLAEEFGLFGDEEEMARALSTQVTEQAIASLRAWKTNGPTSPLRRDVTDSGLRYLQGAAVYLERVYGADVLGAMLSPLVEIRDRPLSTNSLMAGLFNVLRDPFAKNGVAADGVLPVWLPGALDSGAMSADDFVARANLKLKAGQRVSGWFFVPATASTFRFAWKTATPAPNSLRLDGAVSTPAARLAADANNAAALDLKNRSGWQRFQFTATANLEIVAAQFEKTPR